MSIEEIEIVTRMVTQIWVVGMFALLPLFLFKRFLVD